jgi:plasmid stabilization system protein ParE
MKISFVDEAQLELLDAISFYEEARPGLGRRFKDELDLRLQRLRDHPEAYRVRKGGYRRLNLTVFPYYIPYILRAGTLWVLAVAHSRRKPEYWIERRI